MGDPRSQRHHQLHQEELKRAAVVALLVLGLTGCNGGTVDKHALKRDAEKLSSLATEGHLLANDMRKGASTKYYARVHSKELSRAASDMADALARRPTSAGIEPAVRKLSKIAARISQHLEQLHLHPTDRASAASMQNKLSDDADAADRLSK
jgi:replicative superfamily II helicase